MLNAAVNTLSHGARGSVRLVRLDRYARQPSYIHGEVLVRIRRDKATGALLVEAGGDGGARE
ncbi:hypothetical protein [Nonomuraea basaltis]|uniref:hypothetical protein n=1 Tax=Nonomuraea basaltis TaxID=2495887 RepID=UPI00110C6E19|nr:hypothetical protein [Nonomuraea basaltis]TMR94588.1 hypothetical protein EJK15_32990 [Nonomuraea basaltis]